MHPVIVTGLRLKVGRLKDPIIFTQLDRSDMKGGPVEYYTEPVRM